MLNWKMSWSQAHLDSGPLLGTAAVPQGKLSTTLALQRHGLAALQSSTFHQQPGNTAYAGMQHLLQCSFSDPALPHTSQLTSASVVLTDEWEAHTLVMRSAGGLHT